MKKVCLVLKDYEKGGVESVFLKIASGLEASGYQVSFILGKKPGVLSDKIPFRCQVAYGPFLFRWLVWGFLILKNGPDVIISAKEKSNLVSLACKIIRPDLLWIATRHVPLRIEYCSSDAGWITPWLYWLYSFFSDYLVAVSKSGADEIRGLIPCSKAFKVKYIYNPVFCVNDLDLFNQRVDKDPGLIVAAGRLSFQKGFDLLIDGFSQCLCKVPDLSLVIYGDGEERERLEDKISTLGLREKIRILPFSNDLIKDIEKASVFVVSSRWEGFSVVLAESLLTSAVPVAFDCRFGPAEVLESSKFGVLVKEINPLSLSNGILKALKMDVTSWENRRESLNRFSIDKCVRDYIELMRSEIK